MEKYVLFFDIINGFFLSDSCDDYADEENGIFVDVLDEDTFIDAALKKGFDEDRLSCAEVSIESIKKIFDADYSVHTSPGGSCITKNFFEDEDEDEDETEAEKNA